MFKLITILLIGILSGAEMDLFIPSFPELQKKFNLTPFLVQFTLGVNFVTYCLCSLFAGMLGDKYDRRTVILTSLFIFIVGSLFCMLAKNFPTLLVGRALQGVGMAGPAVLTYTIIVDDFPEEKRASSLSMLNGICCVALAFAPVVGSYINLHWGWRSNFTTLFGFGTLCLIMSFFAIPSKKGDAHLSLSLKAYAPLLNSQPFLYFMASSCLLCTAYCVFVGLSPILYMQSLGIGLKEFGYYQGVLAGIYAAVSFMAAWLLSTFTEKRCFYVSYMVCIGSALLVFILALQDVRNPYIITMAMALFSSGLAIPNILLYLRAIEVINNAKGRASALLNAVRLVMTAGGLSLASYYYQGNFFSLGILICACILLGLLMIQVKIKRNWLVLKV